MSRTITVRLKVGDEDHIKKMLKELQLSKAKGNPYAGRSESEIVKMLFVKPLTEANEKYCGK